MFFIFFKKILKIRYIIFFFPNNRSIQFSSIFLHRKIPAPQLIRKMTSLKIVTEQMSVILTSAESRVIRMHLVMKSDGHALRYIPLVCDDFLTLRSCLYVVNLV